MASIKSTCKRKQQFANTIADIYNRAELFQYDENKLNSELLNHVWNNEQFQKLPQWAKAYIRGMDCVLRKCHAKLLVYSYSIDGVRLTIESAEYRKVSPREVYEKWGDSGKFVYRNSGKLFTCQEKGLPNND